jgi:hypothetical protein
MNIGDSVKVKQPYKPYHHHTYAGKVDSFTDDGWVVVKWDSPDEEGWIAEEFHPSELETANE